MWMQSKKVYHTHDWSVTKKVFSPPRVTPKRFGNAEYELSHDIRCLIFGYTTVSYKCTSCGVRETDILVGEHIE